jgi:transposase
MSAVTEKKPTKGRTRGRYPKEFHRDVAALVLDQNRSVADVSRELDLVEQTVFNWVRQEKVDRGQRQGTSTEDREEIAKLKAEVKRLSMERDLLKRSVAFWVKELDR